MTAEFVQRLTGKYVTETLTSTATSNAIAYLENMALARQLQQSEQSSTGSALTSMGSLRLHGPSTPEEAAWSLFQFFDADADNIVTEAELLAALQFLGEVLPNNFWQDTCATLDADPTVGLTELELCAALKTQPRRLQPLPLHTRAEMALAAATSYSERDLARRRARPYVSGRDVHREVVKKLTHDAMVRFVELPTVAVQRDSDGRLSIGPADAFVSWTWDTPWSCVMDILHAHTVVAVTAGRPAPRYWIDIFAVNQHTALPPWRCESNLTACPGCAAGVWWVLVMHCHRCWWCQRW